MFHFQKEIEITLQKTLHPISIHVPVIDITY